MARTHDQDGSARLRYTVKAACRRSEPTEQDAWIYYAQRYASGIHVLFRQAPGQADQACHRQLGWIASDELFDRKRKGEVDRYDLVCGERAARLIRDEA